MYDVHQASGGHGHVETSVKMVHFEGYFNLFRGK